jgi:hypothetical protein
MRRIVLIAAMVLVSASAQAGQSRSLSLAASGGHPPISAPLPPTPANVMAEAPTAVTQPAPAAVTPAPAVVAPPAPAPVTAAPETGAPPVATAPVPPPLPAAPATTAAPAAAPAAATPRYVERPAVAPASTDAPKADDGKPARRAERRHRGGGYWSAGRIMGELQRYGYSYGGYSW